MDHEPTHIRRYQPDDLDDSRRISLLTAHNGQDATRLFDDPMLPGHVHVAPYVLLECPRTAGVGGYVIAALDSQAVEQRLEPEWWPAQRTRYLEPSPDRAEETPLSQRFALQDIHHRLGVERDVAEGFRRTCTSTWYRVYSGAGSGRASA